MYPADEKLTVLSKPVISAVETSYIVLMPTWSEKDLP